MTRFGVMKHLRVLEEAHLVTTRKRGREKLHFLNPVPIRLVHDRWVSKYSEPWAAALSELKTTLEEGAMAARRRERRALRRLDDDPLRPEDAARDR
jgi:DNA-binding transcriptional ArsR family regulator